MLTAAVTGTNGKSSTVSFTREILRSAGYAAASLGTLGLHTPWRCEPWPVVPPGAAALADVAKDLDLQGMHTLVLEAHSGALQRRVLDQLDISAAAFTNLSPDHLDLHGDMERYGRAKRYLFDTLVSRGGTAVLNRDTPQHADLATVCRQRGVRVTSYGRHPAADLRVLAHRRSAQTADGSTPPGSEATLDLQGRTHLVSLTFAAGFLLHNAVCALGIAVALEVPLASAVEALPALIPPAGRLERVPWHSDVQVVIDYAHTPAALEAALLAVRAQSRGRILVVFGCGGERDTGKRAPMGAIAARLADDVVVTDDNPRGESAASIRKEILRGCPNGSEVPERRAAIAEALARANHGDLVLIAGRGHETTQQLAEGERPCSDRDIVSALADDACWPSPTTPGAAPFPTDKQAGPY